MKTKIWQSFLSEEIFKYTADWKLLQKIILTRILTVDYLLSKTFLAIAKFSVSVKDKCWFSYREELWKPNNHSGSFPPAIRSKGVSVIKWKEHDLSFHLQFTSLHILFHYPNFLTERRNILLSKVSNISSNILNQADATVTRALLFGNPKHSNEVNL